MKPSIQAAILLLFAIPSVRAEDFYYVQGRVIDETGKPVENADVSYFWYANGPLNGPNGKPYDEMKAEGRAIIAANLGRMFPLGSQPAKTGNDGRFKLRVYGSRARLMAMDKSRSRGGLVIPPTATGAGDVEIHLLPLVRIRGSIEGPEPGVHPEDVVVLATLPDNVERPLDMTTLALCTAVNGRFEMSLPPGRYVLNIYTITRDANYMASVAPDKEILLTGNASEIDLGVLRLGPFKPRPSGRMQQARAKGTWGDYTKLYGKKPPQWHITDARGVNKQAQISDFKGKWLLVYFWGLPCTVCLKRGLPDLAKFYSDHQARRDRFEILSICMDVDGELKSIVELEKKLEPIVKHVWSRPLPFPMLLDPSFTTWERYGLSAYGTLILIDPDGNLVKGDEAELARKLAGQ